MVINILCGLAGLVGGFVLYCIISYWCAKLLGIEERERCEKKLRNLEGLKELIAFNQREVIAELADLRDQIRLLRGEIERKKKKEKHYENMD